MQSLFLVDEEARGRACGVRVRFDPRLGCGGLLLWLGLENMAGAFEEDVEKTVTIDEYLEDVEAQELVNFVETSFLGVLLFCL